MEESAGILQEYRKDLPAGLLCGAGDSKVTAMFQAGTAVGSDAPGLG